MFLSEDQRSELGHSGRDQNSHDIASVQYAMHLMAQSVV
jgi:hypothetical protein